MLDQIFKKSPTKSHARSGSTPHLRDSLSNSFFPSGSTLSDDVFSDDLPIASLRRGQERGRNPLHHSFDVHIVDEPSNTLQSDPDISRHFTRDLPPLLASPNTLESPSKTLISRTDAHSKNPINLPQRSPQPSPTHFQNRSTPSLPGDHTKSVSKEPASKLASWFKGESTPISIGILPSPTKEDADPLATMPPMKPTPVTPKPGLTSRFSFFTKSSPNKSDLEQDQDDGFLNMDFSTALYPAIGATDSFSPASVKGLAQNAESLFSRLQNAYRERTILLRDMTAEKETVAEELEGEQTRSRHLKIQLDDLSARVVEQDKAMMELVDEMANLKRIRVEEEDARKRTIRPVMPSMSTPPAHDFGVGGQSSRRRPRKDRPSSSSSTTDCESDNESVFSRNHNTSPRMSLSSVSTTSSPESYHQPDLSFTVNASTQAARRRTARIQSGKSGQLQHLAQEAGCVWSCANCQGGDASEAWGVVGMLKEENRCLKERVEHVEGALEGCLDVVARLG